VATSLLGDSDETAETLSMRCVIRCSCSHHRTNSQFPGLAWPGQARSRPSLAWPGLAWHDVLTTTS